MRRADGTLDRTGYLGATADLIKSSGRLQGLDAARTSPREKNTTQLGRAVLERDETLVRKLIAAGADLNAVDANGNSPLHLVSSGKENFNVLLKQGKNIVRIADGDARIVTLLLDGKYEGKGANINLRNAGGSTPLHLASRALNEAVVIRLIENGADVTLQDENGRTALNLARFNKYVDESGIEALLCRELLALRGAKNTTQLGRAVLERDETLVRKLIAAGADLNAVDANGNSPLHLVSSGKENFNVLLKQGKNIVRIADGDARIVTLLLDGKYEGKGANINLRNAGGSTPLHLASRALNEAVVIRLIENGADVTLQDENGRTALNLARFNKYVDESGIEALLCRELLALRGAK